MRPFTGLSFGAAQCFFKMNRFKVGLVGFLEITLLEKKLKRFISFSVIKEVWLETQVTMLAVQTHFLF
jgi:hypothetical protein